MRKFSASIVLALLLLLPVSVWASYSTIVAFGDSLSDNGYADGYGYGVWTNGSVWLTYLADSSHLNCTLQDYAFGGATTASTYANLGWQVSTYLTANPTISNSSSTLFTLWAGGNDFLAIFNNPAYSTWTDAQRNAAFYAAINTAATNMAGAVNSLVTAGAKNILVMDLPNLGATPFLNWDPSTMANGQALTMGYNYALGQAMAGFSGVTGLNLYTFSTYAFLQDALAHPGTYNFANTEDALSDAENPVGNYVFWDSIHPTTYTHSLIAGEVEKVVTPIPAPLLLMGTGLVGLAGLRRRIGGRG